jgi:hypothetical protein
VPEQPPGGLESSGGEGLCNEFKMDEASMGWDDNDRFFLKPGVGLLERTDDKPYNFFKDYGIVKPFPCFMHTGNDYADFHMDALPLKGISYSMDKHIGVIGDMLHISTTIANHGENPLYFREYNHNFLSMDGLGAHPKVSLTLNKKYKNQNETPGLIMNEDNITFADNISGYFMIICQEPIAYAPKRWELVDNKSGMSVQEWGDFDVTGFLAWGGRHVIAPEIYGDFPVAPGQRRTWTRMWKFSLF